MQNHYDIIIIGAGAAGLFACINAPKNLNKLILEKNKEPGIKVLLSGGERANVSNIDIETSRDYFGQNKKVLISMFKKYNNFDLISYFAENGINIIEEDRGRLILESGDSKELLSFLLKKSYENNTKIKCQSGVVDVMKIGEKFEVLTQDGLRYTSDKLVITTGGKSFFQVGTTGDGYKWALDFGHKINTPHRGLCGIVSKKDLSEISGISCDVSLEVIVKNQKNNKIYSEIGPILFTHFGVSGPIIFNSAVFIGEYINSVDLTSFIENLDFSKIPENEKLDYIDRNFLKENIFLKINFDIEKTPKRILKFFELNSLKTEIILELQDFRSWKEAKVTSGGIKLDELTNNLESKIVPNLYFAGEILDITGKTGGFNLQFAWTSSYIVGKNL